MAEELHRQRVLNFLEVFYSGDIEGALARCTDDIDFFSNAPVDILPHMGHRHGQAEMRETWQTIHARYSSMRHEVPIIVAEGDKVAANIRVFFANETTTGSCSSTSRPSTLFATAALRRSARSWTPSIWSNRCWSATSPPS
jgi:ketosteroid isomerase-like protein